MNVVRGVLGIKSKSQKRLEGLQEDALTAQKRASNAALEDGAVIRAEQAASGRRLRGLGRRALAFMGNELGVPGGSSLAGG